MKRETFLSYTVWAVVFVVAALCLQWYSEGRVKRLHTVPSPVAAASLPKTRVQNQLYSHCYEALFNEFILPDDTYKDRVQGIRLINNHCTAVHLKSTQ